VWVVVSLYGGCNTVSVDLVVEVLVVTPVLAALVVVYHHQTFFHRRPISSTILFQVIISI
jgi:hypothetical protein